MEKVIRKGKVPLYLVIIVLILIAGVAVGIYYLTGGGREKTPSRGTFVMSQTEEEYTI